MSPAGGEPQVATRRTEDTRLVIAGLVAGIQPLPSAGGWSVANPEERGLLRGRPAPEATWGDLRQVPATSVLIAKFVSVRGKLGTNLAI